MWEEGGRVKEKGEGSWKFISGFEGPEPGPE
jgi:hypothetical protein